MAGSGEKRHLAELRFEGGAAGHTACLNVWSHLEFEPSAAVTQLTTSYLGRESFVTVHT